MTLLLVAQVCVCVCEKGMVRGFFIKNKQDMCEQQEHWAVVVAYRAPRTAWWGVPQQLLMSLFVRTLPGSDPAFHREMPLVVKGFAGYRHMGERVVFGCCQVARLVNSAQGTPSGRDVAAPVVFSGAVRHTCCS